MVIKSLTRSNQVEAALSSVIVTQEYIICIEFGTNKVLKGAVSRNSAKLGNYKMPVRLRETQK